MILAVASEFTAAIHEKKYDANSPSHYRKGKLIAFDGLFQLQRLHPLRDARGFGDQSSQSSIR